MDLLEGGFPCKAWSQLGLGESAHEKERRGRVWLAIARYANRSLPRVAILENVDGPHRPAAHYYVIEYCENAASYEGCGYTSIVGMHFNSEPQDTWWSATRRAAPLYCGGPEMW